MLADRIEHRWIDAFERTFALCGVAKDEPCAILSETQSRTVNVHLAELALQRMGAAPFHVTAITPSQSAQAPVRSTGATRALQAHGGIMAALKASPFIVDLTVEGLMHAPELPEILKAGARVLTISNEHPDALERLVPDPALKDHIRGAAKLLRTTAQMTVTSAAGTDLRVAMDGASTVGIWGFTDKPGTLAHWPGGIVVSFPKARSTNGTLVLDAGDINLTFKRYLENQIVLTIEDDYVTKIEGEGTDAELMRRYWRVWDDKEAYAVSHVGWGMNEACALRGAHILRSSATSMAPKCVPMRAISCSRTGANEFAEPVSPKAISICRCSGLHHQRWTGRCVVDRRHGSSAGRIRMTGDSGVAARCRRVGARPGHRRLRAFGRDRFGCSRLERRRAMAARPCRPEDLSFVGLARQAVRGPVYGGQVSAMWF